MTILRHTDILDLASFTKTELVEMPVHVRLRGMKRDLNPEERVQLAHYYGALRLINRLGGVKPEFIKKEALADDHFGEVPEELLK